MRIPESGKINLALQGLNKSNAKANAITEQVASGKKLNRLSDDPIASTKVEALKSSISKGDNILKDFSLDFLWLNNMDTSINRMVDILRYAKVKALEAANSFQSEESLATIASEVDAMRHELFELGNLRVNDLYVYSGSKTFTAPLIKGWPYQLPGTRGAENLFHSKAVIDDVFILDLNVNQDIDADFDDIKQAPKTLELSTFWSDPTTLDADTDTEENNGYVDLKNNPYKLSNPYGEAYQYKIEVSGKDSAQSIVDKINDAMASKYSYEVADKLPGELKQDAHAYVGSDGRIYFQALAGVSIGFAKSFSELMPMEQAGAVQVELLPPGEQGTGFYGEYAAGFTDKPLLVRITKEGNIGDAHYSVSDDGAQTWSPDRRLSWQNEIYNTNGLASSNISLNFARSDEARFLAKDLEFVIDANPSVVYQGNNQPRFVPLDNGDKKQINITANQLFFADGENQVDVFNLLDKLQNNIAKGSIEQIGKHIEDLDSSINQVLKYRATAGITTQKITATRNRIEQKNIESLQAVSELEDADLAKAATDLNLNSIHRQAMMETVARVVQPSLVQFLR
ncbi:MAG: hypothetical protein JJV97_06620 [SAR324 cluster bacterium]|nr:hypothetical protein [SAR324 cluster bacterium]